jgi:hypothetical protein
MKLTIHIGTRKTGTTSIQEFLRRNKEALARNGTYILDYSSLNQHEFALAADVSYNLKYYIEKLKRTTGYNFQEYSDNFFAQLKHEIESLPNEINHVVVSSEDCSLLDDTSIHYLKEKLSRIFSDIKVIAYFRRQDKYAASNVTTALRSGYTVDLNNIFDTGDIKHLFYNKIMMNWSESFGFENINCRIFEAEKLLKNDLLFDFLSHSNISLTDNLDFTRISNNESIDILTAKCIEVYNSSRTLVNEDEYFRDTIIKSISDQNITKFLPERCKALQFQSLFEQENIDFHNYFFNGYGELFNDSFDDYPESQHDKDIIHTKSIEALLKLIVEGEKKTLKLEETITTLNKNVEFLNNLAKKFERQNDPKTALSLYKICKMIRPNGSYINNKIQELGGA